MREGLKVFDLVFLVLLSIPFAAVAIGLSGCLPKPSAQASESLAEPLHLLDLIALWSEQAEGKDMPSFREITVSDGDVSDGKVSFFVNIHSWKPERYAEPHAQLHGTADQGTSRIIEISVYGSTYGPAFTEEKIAYLRPYAQTMIGAIDSSLTDAECARILDELRFSVDHLAELEESLRSLSSEKKPVTERNGIRYSLNHWGSEEGGTVEVMATMLSRE